MVRNLKGKLVAPAQDPIAQADIAWFEAHEGRVVPAARSRAAGV